MIAHDLLTLHAMASALPGAVVVFGGHHHDRWRHYACWLKYYKRIGGPENLLRSDVWKIGYAVMPGTDVQGNCCSCQKPSVRPRRAD